MYVVDVRTAVIYVLAEVVPPDISVPTVSVGGVAPVRVKVVVVIEAVVDVAENKIEVPPLYIVCVLTPVALFEGKMLFKLVTKRLPVAGAVTRKVVVEPALTDKICGRDMV